MNVLHDPYNRANLSFRKTAVQRFQRLQNRQRILRSQVGFLDTSLLRPTVCEGCINYHGIAYGATDATKTLLVCAFHPSGWHGDTPCPDWRGMP
jgi:hypothetical protein